MGCQEPGIKQRRGQTATILLDQQRPEKPVVRPAKVTGLKTSRNKKTGAVKLKWKKQSGVDGYLVYRSEKKKGSYKLVKTLKKASAVSCTDKKAKKAKTYYYKVCTYRKAANGKVTGSCSAVKTVKKK